MIRFPYKTALIVGAGPGICATLSRSLSANLPATCEPGLLDDDVGLGA
jgi:hypothetical protein